MLHWNVTVLQAPLKQWIVETLQEIHALSSASFKHGVVRKYLDFLLLLKIVKYFFKICFQSIPYLCLYTFAICLGAFASANHDIDLLPRYQFMAEIKAALVSYLFLVSIFSVLETNKTRRGQGLGCREGGTTIATWRSWCSTVDEVVWEGALSCKGRMFF